METSDVKKKEEYQPDLVKTLQSSPPGRDILGWVCAVDTVVRNHGRSGSGSIHVHGYITNFCRHYKLASMCLGMPRTTPFITAVLNMAGVKRMVYLDDPQFIHMMVVTGPESTERVQRGVQQVITRALENRHRGMGLLLCYSGPLFKETDQIYWELRTLSRRERVKKSGGTEVEINDSDLMFNSHSTEARMASRTLDSDYADLRIKDAEMKSFEETFCAANLDVSSTTSIDLCSAAAMMETTAQAKLGKMHELAKVLAADRDKAIQTVEAQKLDYLKQIENATNEGRAVSARVADRAEAAKNIQVEQSEALKSINLSLHKQCAALEKSNELLKSQKNGAELLITTERTQLTAKIGIAEQQTKDAKKALSEAGRHQERSMEKLEKSHSRTIEEMERSSSSAKIELRVCNQKLTSAVQSRQLTEGLLERAQNERLVALSELDNLKISATRVKVCKALLSVAGIRHKDLKTDLSNAMVLARLANERAEASDAQLDKVDKTLKQTVKEREKAVKEREKAVKSLKRFTESSDNSSNARSTSPVTPTTSNVQEVQTDMMQEMFEIGDLKNENVKLCDELARISKEFEDERTKAKKKKRTTSPPVDCVSEQAPVAPDETALTIDEASDAQSSKKLLEGVVPMHQEPTATFPLPSLASSSSDIDKKFVGEIDSASAAFIEQAESAHRALIAMARKSIINKQMAEESEAKFVALQSVTMHQPAMAMRIGNDGQAQHQMFQYGNQCALPQGGLMQQPVYMAPQDGYYYQPQEYAQPAQLQQPQPLTQQQINSLQHQNKNHGARGYRGNLYRPNAAVAAVATPDSNPANQGGVVSYRVS